MTATLGMIAMLGMIVALGMTSDVQDDDESGHPERSEGSVSGFERDLSLRSG
jgi:hypothetical protein